MNALQNKFLYSDLLKKIVKPIIAERRHIIQISLQWRQMTVGLCVYNSQMFLQCISVCCVLEMDNVCF